MHFIINSGFKDFIAPGVLLLRRRSELPALKKPVFYAKENNMENFIFRDVASTSQFRDIDTSRNANGVISLLFSTVSDQLTYFKAISCNSPCTLIFNLRLIKHSHKPLCTSQ